MRICIYGLGAVGETVAAHLLATGHRVTCVDVDEQVVEAVRDGVFFEASFEDAVTATTSGENAVPESEVIILAVPTPLDTSYSVDLDPLREATADVADSLAEATGPEAPLVVIESTVPPGTTETVVAPRLEARGLTVGRDCRLAVAPERIDPGNDEWPLARIPRVVGAVTDDGREQAVAFYEEILEASVRPVDTPGVAEASKIVENAFRDVNIAFVNELAVSLDELGIDTKEVLDAAATKPFGFMRFSPGAGVGGDCIPVDPYLLIDRAAGAGFDHEFLKLARKINRGMPEYVVDRTIHALNDVGVLPNGATALLLGRSFKPGIADDRNSPYHTIVEGLAEYGVETDFYDPFWPEQSVADPESVTADVAVLVTAHEEVLAVDWSRLADNGVEILVDGRNAVDPGPVRQAGLAYVGVGREGPGPR